MRYNLVNLYGTIIASGSFLAIQKHLIRLVSAGLGQFEDYDIIPQNGGK